MNHKFKKIAFYNLIVLLVAVQLVILINYWYFVFTNISQASIRDTIAYQGKIVDMNSVAITDGSYKMRYSIYDTLTGGNLLWTEVWDGTDQNTTLEGIQGGTVTITQGIFSVELNSLCASWLGNCASNGGVDFNTNSLYLLVELDRDGNGAFEETFLPRKRFSSVAYSMNSDKLDGKDVGTSGNTIPVLDADNTWTGLNTIVPVSAATKGFIIKGATSQSANLQEWQNDSGTQVAGINPSGSLILGDGAVNAKLNIYGSMAAGDVPGFYMSNSATISKFRLGWSQATSILSETNLSSNLYNTAGQWNLDDTSGAGFLIDFLPRYDEGAPAMLLVTASAGANPATPRLKYPLAVYGNTHAMRLGSSTFSVTPPTAAVEVGSGSTTQVNLAVKQFAAGTANLTQWTNSAGTPLTVVTSVGNLGVKNAAPTYAFDLTDNNVSGFNARVVGTAGAARFIIDNNNAAQNSGFELWAQGARKVAVAYVGASSNYTTFYNSVNLRNLFVLSNTATGEMTVGGAATPFGQLGVQSSTSSIIPVVAKGAAAQAADLQQWQTSTGAVLMRVTSGGNVGIGATVPAWSSAYNVLQMGQYISMIGQPSGTAAGLEYNLYYDGTNYRYLNTNPASEFAFGGGTFWVRTAASGTAGGVATLSTRLAVSNAGEVTVGSSSANGQFFIDNQVAGTVASTIQGATAQTANLTEWEDSLGDLLLSVSSAGVLTSGVPDGTAPFVVTSTTKVQNLNADLLDGYDSSYFATSTSQGNYLPTTGGTMGGQIIEAGIDRVTDSVSGDSTLNVTNTVSQFALHANSGQNFPVGATITTTYNLTGVSAIIGQSLVISIKAEKGNTASVGDPVGPQAYSHVVKLQINGTEVFDVATTSTTAAETANESRILFYNPKTNSWVSTALN